jgi:hypothetical protein
MINKIHEQWMKLDPTKQYLYWIITFSILLFVCCMSLVVTLHFDLLTMAALPYITFGILGFAVLFIAVIVFLNIIWPHEYEKEQKEDQ